jgi:DNA repair protein RecN (Recombination protein N)
MLRALAIRDFVIVERIELEFAAGFTALTGETGAGKSILIDALALALGERSDAATVRQGADRTEMRAEISAEFDVAGNKLLRKWLADNDLAGEDDCCLLRRVVDSSGRSRAFINGRACTLQQLREAGEYLVDIHGQHEHQSLLRTAAQRELLDAYGGCAGLADVVVSAWWQWRELREQLTALETNAGTIAAEREQVEWQIRDIEALDFNLEGWQETQAEHARLAHGQNLIEGAQYALEVLSEGDGAALSQIASVDSRLSQLIEYDARLKDIVDIIASVQAQTQEAVYMLRDYQERLEIDPQRFREIEQRLDAVHTMARKWRVMPDTLPDALSRARQRLDQLGGDADVETVRTRAAAAHEVYLTEAKKLTSARKKAAKKLSEKVTAAMQTLAMAGGSFEVALNVLDEGNSNGLEQVEFLVSSHKGTESRALAKVASGGELSRISLALQTVTSEIAQVPTLIFDEVDAGIGGGVAEIVGRMLKKLGAERQVMCVTHLPQVAAAADQQWQVAKTAINGKVSSHVAVLDGKQRVEEIARMLGGVKITDTSRKHAAEMLGNGK